MSKHETADFLVSITEAASTETSRSMSKLLSQDGDNMTIKLLNPVEDKMRAKSTEFAVPNMWTKEYIGLYSQYAAVGLVYGSSGTFYPFCSYVFNGPSNVCANAKNIVFFAWGFKLFFAFVTDSYRPFGLRRKPWLIFGWLGVLVTLLSLAVFADQMSVSTWLAVQLVEQVFMMFADVPADGYSVELGQLEPPEQRGQILATGQRIRFTFCIVAGVIQTFLLNGPKTSSSGCQISVDNCWSWGLSMKQYYALLFCIVFVLHLPLYYLQEPDASNYPRHSLKGLFGELWITLQNLTTFYLLIFVLGMGIFAQPTSAVNIFLQYYIIDLTNFQAGIDTITTYSGLVVAIYLFQLFLIRRNWRTTQYGSVVLNATLGLLWIFAYYNVGGTRNAWYTIFVDLDQNFSQGLNQVLFSMSVIELAKKGQEATTYELIITVYNTALTVSSILATQLLTLLNASGCTDDDCPSNSVNLNSESTYVDSNGPWKFTEYALILFGVSIVASFLFTRFLPSCKEECHEWREQGESSGGSRTRGIIATIVVVIVVMYGIAVAILLLDDQTSCEPAVGGSGC